MTTTIAGFAGEGSQPVTNLCRAALAAMHLFGDRPAIGSLGPAAFGSLSGRTRDAPPSAPGSGPAHLCVLDGRLDNAEELCRQLGLSLPVDGAAILSAAWARWGTATVDRLIGDYAFALFDERSRELWLARDPGGHRPLFYRAAGGVIGFSSMPSGLTSAFAAEEPDLAQLARYLDGRPRRADATFWRMIRQVPPGSILRFRGGQVTSKDILDPPAPMRRAGDWQELIAEMLDRLDRAVARNLAGESGIVGGHLSSGLDSSAVVTSAARLVGKPRQIVALTAAPHPDARLLVSRGRYADESILAAETARMNGTDHVIVHNRERLLPAIRGTAPFFQQPAPAQFSFPWWRETCEIVRQRGGSVLLTSGQGNATLSYGGLDGLSRYLAQGRVGEWWRQIRTISENEDVRLRGLLFNSARPLIPKWLSDRMLRAVKHQPLEAKSYVRREWKALPDDVPDPPFTYMGRRLHMLRRFDAGWRNRGMFALTGVEERDPSSDRELIDFTLSLPPEAQVGFGRIKPLIRDALAGRVPQAILDNRQRGVSGADWYDRITPADCREALEDIRSSTSASALLDLDKLDRAIKAWPAFDPAREGMLGEFGRSIAKALSTGLFLAETDRYPLGKAERQ